MDSLSHRGSDEMGKKHESLQAHWQRFGVKREKNFLIFVVRLIPFSLLCVIRIQKSKLRGWEVAGKVLSVIFLLL